MRRGATFGRASLVAWAFGAVLAGELAPALAQGEPPSAETSAAAELYASALAKFDGLDYAGALPLFQQALAASDSPNAALYVARCLRELGRAPEAYEAMRHAVKLSSARARDEPRFTGTRDAAIAELAELEQYVGRIYVSLTDPPAGAVVSLGGRVVPISELEVLELDGSRRATGGAETILPFAVEPGAVRVSVTAAGLAPFERDIDVRPGPPKRLVVPVLGELTGDAPVTPPPPALDASGDTDADGDAQRVMGLIVGGVGVAGLAVGGVAGAMALGKSAEGDEACEGTACTQQGLDLHDEANTLANVSNVGFIAGAALVAVGAVVFFTAPSAAEAALGSPLVLVASPTAEPELYVGWRHTF